MSDKSFDLANLFSKATEMPTALDQGNSIGHRSRGTYSLKNRRQALKLKRSRQQKRRNRANGSMSQSYR